MGLGQLIRTFYNGKPSIAWEVEKLDDIRFAVDFDEKQVIKSVDLFMLRYGEMDAKGKPTKICIFSMKAGERPKVDR